MGRQDGDDAQVGKARAGVIVGIDGSEGAARALEWTVAKRELFGPVTPVLAYRVDALGDGVGTPAFYAEVAEIMADEADRLLAEAIDGHPDLAERARSVRGFPGRCLVDAAGSASLLVVGSRGRSALAETLLGSIGSYCTKHAPVPVAVIPPDTEVEPTIDEIVVGIDGSSNSIAALRWAVDHVSPWGRVVAVACWLPTPVVEASLTSPALEHDAKAALHRAIADVGPTVTEDRNGEGPSIEARVEYGDARHVLGELAAGADLLVIGARGSRGVPYLLLGSVTTSLLHHPTTATVVVPDPGHGKDGA